MIIEYHGNEEYILKIFIIIVILVIIVLQCVVEYAFKNTFLKYKKDKRDAFKVLKERGMLDESIYNEIEFKMIPVQRSIDLYNERGNKDDDLLVVKGASHLVSYKVEMNSYEECVSRFINRCINRK